MLTLTKTLCKFCGKEGIKGGSMSLHMRSCILNPERVAGISFGKKHSALTKRSIGKNNGEGTKIPATLFDVSKRTLVKILSRIGKGCSNCGWNEASCDIHHIVPRSKGGTDDHTNLTVLCPNCHRLAHSRKLTNFVSVEEQIGDEWRDHYYAHK